MSVADEAVLPPLSPPEGVGVRAADDRWVSFSIAQRTHFQIRTDWTEAGARVGLWEVWLDVAERHTEFAEECRFSDDEVDTTAAVGHGEEPGPYPDVRLVAGADELAHSMVAISAAAHALDGLYGAVRVFVTPPPSKKRPPRHGRILETLKLGFRIGPHVKAWTAEFEWLFDVRDAIVHHSDDYRALRISRETERTVCLSAAIADDPQFDVNAVTARRAATLARDVVQACVASPKRATRNWAAGWARSEPGPGEMLTPEVVESRSFPLPVVLDLDGDPS